MPAIRTLQPLYEKVLLELYSQGFINQNRDRMFTILKNTPGAAVGITAADITVVINRFDILKTSMKEQLKEGVRGLIDSGNIKAKDPHDTKRIKKLYDNPLELTFYDYHDLSLTTELFPDRAEERRQKKEMEAAGSASGATRIYNQNNIEIYFGASHKECRTFENLLTKVNGPKLKAAGLSVGGTSMSSFYSWCIGWSSDNMYRSYRLHGDTSGSIYFVINNDLPVTDPTNAVVVIAQKDGRYRYARGDNDRTNEAVLDWNGVLKRIPKLKGLEELFQYQPLSEEEQDAMAMEHVTAGTFAELSPKNKKTYILMGKPIYGEDYLDLHSDLQNLYIEVRGPNMADTDMKKRFDIMYDLFADRDPEFLKRKMEGLTKRSKEILFSNPILMNSKKNGTYKLWQNKINDIFGNWSKSIKK